MPARRRAATDSDSDQLYDSSEGEAAVEHRPQPRPKALGKPRIGACSIPTLYKRLKRDLIDLDAEYQREIVWDSKRQIELIDSVVNNLYIPPILFSVQPRKSRDAEPIHRCIDGKQRLTAIKRFMDNEIPWIDPETGHSWYYSAGGKHGKPKRNYHWEDRLRNAFEMKEFTTVEYDALEDQDERDIFARVQRGMALTAAEKVQASAGNWSQFVKNLTELIGISEEAKKFDGLHKRVLDLSRGKAFILVASFLQAYMDDLEGKEQGFFKLNYIQRNLISRGDDIDVDVKRNVENALQRIAEIAVAEEGEGVGGTAPVPELFTTPRKPVMVEMIFATFFISKFDHLSDEQLLEAIGIMFKKFRETFDEKTPRLSAKTSNWLENWVKNFNPADLVKTNRKNRNKPARRQKTTPEIHRSATPEAAPIKLPTSSTLTPRKRGRNESFSSDEELPDMNPVQHRKNATPRSRKTPPPSSAALPPPNATPSSSRVTTAMANLGVYTPKSTGRSRNAGAQPPPPVADSPDSSAPQQADSDSDIEVVSYSPQFGAKKAKSRK